MDGSCLAFLFLSMNQVVADKVQQSQVGKLPVLVVAVFMVDFNLIFHCEEKPAMRALSALVLEEFSSN